MKTEIFLDLSTVASGYAVYQDGIYHSSGTMALSPKKEPDGVKRTYQMLNLINSLLLAYQPNNIHIEALPYMTHIGHETLTYLHGGVKFLAMTHGIDFESRNFPSHWQKVLGFDRSEKQKRELSKILKVQSKNYASTIAGKTITDDNEADAICLGAAYYSEFSNTEGNQINV